MTDTTPHPLADENGVVDFTIRREPIRFKIDDDVFSAPPIIGGFTLKRLVGRYEEFTKIDLAKVDEKGFTEALRAMGAIFNALMPGPSGRLFAERLLLDPEAEASDAEVEGREPRLPIDLQRQAVPAMNYLLERYGMRPTQQSSPLPASSVTGDSTDGAQPEESTGEPSTMPSNS